METVEMERTMERLANPGYLAALRDRLRRARDPKRVVVRVCMTGCRAHGAVEVLQAFRHEIDRRGLAASVDLLATGCHGFCAMAPVLVVDPHDFFYGRVAPADVPEIVDSSVVAGEPVARLLYTDPLTGAAIPRASDIPFYRDQLKIVLRNCGLIDPRDLRSYIERDGYAAAAKALGDMTPESVIEEVARSGLRGRGGAGFPTGRKWSMARAAAGSPKHLICNADEGDPGAFMDRAVLEGDPHAVIEGMIVAAYAMGASEGFVYVRAEYPIAVEHLGIAIRQAEEAGLLGERILGSPFSFTIEIRKGSGAFVCGETTALIASLEGRRGMPRPRPPFLTKSGYLRRPTCINNVETLASIAPIILRGGAWYAGIGTPRSTGTKVFALAGKVENTGLVEVPMGIPLRSVVFGIGGGIPDGLAFKAVQTGGPSGGCIPAAHLDLPVDYESLAGVGSIMGSGGMIVADERTCMVDFARFFMEFIQEESCGKCVPCRIGTRRMLETLEGICGGRGAPADLELLAELAATVRDSSLCGLGQTAPNPVLTTLRYFGDEYRAHIERRKCPAKVCRDLLRYEVIAGSCTGCLACKKACPADAITGERKEAHLIHQEKCIRCGACFTACKFDAILVE